MEAKTPIKRKAGRPKKEDVAPDMRQNFIDAAIDILIREGVEQVTVRNVCEKAGVSTGTYYHYFKNKDDLLGAFLQETTYGGVVLHTPFTDLPGRMLELWKLLLELYRSMGVDFTRSYYNCNNAAISAYLQAGEGHFQEGSLLERSRQELVRAQEEGYLAEDADPFFVAGDLCDILKGCIFEWCLCKGDMPVEDAVHRIITNYMAPISRNQEK